MPPSVQASAQHTARTWPEGIRATASAKLWDRSISNAQSALSDPCLIGAVPAARAKATPGPFDGLYTWLMKPRTQYPEPNLTEAFAPMRAHCSACGGNRVL